jgi:zinc carboxypeptidase
MTLGPFAGIALALAGTVLLQAAPGTERRVEIAWNRYYDPEGIADLLRRIAAAHPELASLSSIGQSFEGRDMWLLTIHNPKTGREGEKPAMWVDGNVHGNEVQGGEAAVYLAWFLTEEHGRSSQVTELVDRAVFYILPMQNPDGRAHWFQAPNTPSTSRSGKRPVDNDQDGRFDEDGPDDLDGDGEIVQMRKRIPGQGDWRVDPDDPRRMVRAPAGKTGDYVMLGAEGIDNDGDGAINEDGPGGYDLNRNWPSDWQPNHVQSGAGDYPLSQPESRAIADFIVAHPNIAAIQSFHNAGGMILRGPGAASFGEYPSADVAVFDDLGLQGEKMLPFYRYMVIHRDLYTVHGGFVNWGFEGLGIFSLTNELWTGDQLFANQEARRGPAFPRVADDGRRRPRSEDDGSTRQDDLIFDELVLAGGSFVPWHTVKHPTYGEIELGGFRKMTGRVPPAFMIEEMLHRNALFCVYHAEQMPRVLFEDAKAERLQGDAFAVSVTLWNEKRIPTRSAHAAAKGIGLPDLLTISGEGIAVVSGGIARDRFRANEVALAEHEPGRLLLNDGVPSQGRVTARWIVRGRGEVTVAYRGEKAAPAQTSLRIE